METLQQWFSAGVAFTCDAILKVSSGKFHNLISRHEINENTPEKILYGL